MDRNIMEQDGNVEELELDLILQEPVLLKLKKPMDQLWNGTGCHVQVSTGILHHRL